MRRAIGLIFAITIFFTAANSALAYDLKFTSGGTAEATATDSSDDFLNWFEANATSTDFILRELVIDAYQGQDSATLELLNCPTFGSAAGCTHVASSSQFNFIDDTNFTQPTTVSFGSDALFSAGEVMALRLVKTGEPNTRFQCNNDIWPNSSGNRCGGTNGLWFSMYGENAATGPSISLIRPENGTSTTNEANSGLFWGISVDPTASSTCSISTPCRVAVHYWLGTSTEALASPGVLIDYDAIYSTSTIDEKYFDKSFDIANGTWSAAAYLYTGFNYPLTVAVSSTVSNFTITGSNVPGGSNSTTTIASSTLECNSGNWFQDGFCGAISWLFYPPPGSLDMYSNLSEAIKYKPPIGYLVSMTSALGDITNGTSSISLMDASTTAAFSGIFDPVKTGVGWLLWLTLGIWSFNRIKTMEL